MDLFATALFGRDACKAIGSQENMQQGFVTSDEVEAADLCRWSGQCHVLFPPCNPCNEGIRKAVQLPHAPSHRHIFMNMSWNIYKMFFRILSGTRLYTVHICVSMFTCPCEYINI